MRSSLISSIITIIIITILMNLLPLPVSSTSTTFSSLEASTSVVPKNPAGTVAYRNASELLDELLRRYDVRLRPGFGGDALLLSMDVVIASFDAVSEVDMDFTLTMYLHQYWHDDRLSWDIDEAGQLPKELTLSGEFAQNIWVPDTFVANDKMSYLHDVTEPNKMLRIHHDGRVALGMRFTSTLACPMDLHNYPLDTQNCTVEIESYGYTTKEVLMRWREPRPVDGIDRADVPQFIIRSHHTLDSIVTTATGSYQRLRLLFELQRTVGFFIFQTYVPCILIVTLSWVSFWINHEATSARVALGITTVLTMTTISTGLRQSLPRISYVKSIDIYLVTCFLFVFAALLEYAAVNYNHFGRRKQPIRAGTEEGWPVQIGNGAAPNKEDEESAMRINWQGVEMSTLVDRPSDASSIAGRPSPRSEPLRLGNRSITVDNTSSPLHSIYGGDTASNFPSYPRFTPSTVRRRNFSRRAFGAFTTSLLGDDESGELPRRQTIKASLNKMRLRARAALPTLRVRDVNKIDKCSRIVFPMIFIAFNVFYWSYYLAAQQTGSSFMRWL